MDKKDVVSAAYISDGVDQNVLVVMLYCILDPDILVQKKSIMK
jgi:hypothetical protein